MQITSRSVSPRGLLDWLLEHPVAAAVQYCIPWQGANAVDATEQDKRGKGNLT